MRMRKPPRIKRKALIKLTFKLIDAHADRLSDSMRSQLLYTACTVKTVALNSWDHEGSRCLVGETRVRLGVSACPRVTETASLVLGCAFNDLLRKHLEKRDYVVSTTARVVEVVD